LNFIASMQASAAIDAQRPVEPKVRMALIGRDGFARAAQCGRLEAEPVHQPLNFGSILTGAESPGWISGKVQRQNVAAQRIDAGRAGANFHSRQQRCVAGGVNLSESIGLHQTNAASALGRKVGVITKRWNVDAGPTGSLENGLALTD
jgi:hypothetical protein